jgi:hypothetical protein
MLIKKGFATGELPKEKPTEDIIAARENHTPVNSVAAIKPLPRGRGLTAERRAERFLKMLFQSIFHPGKTVKAS